MHTISVVIPAYNASKYIVQCLEQIFNQTYKQLEVIVVDDGSTDNTSELASEYPVKLIQQVNQGVSVARNKGMEVATGDYLHFMDVDDLIALDFYLNMYDSICAVDADMTCCNVYHERLPALSSKIKNTLLITFLDDKIDVSNVFSQGAVYKYLFKSTLLKENNLQFNTELIIAEDKYFSLQAIFFSKKFTTCPSAVYLYKNRPNSYMTTSSKNARKKRKEYLLLADQYCHDFAKNHNFKIHPYKSYTTRIITLFKLPLFKIRTYQSGRKKWKFLNITILHSKI